MYVLYLFDVYKCNYLIFGKNSYKYSSKERQWNMYWNNGRIYKSDINPTGIHDTVILLDINFQDVRFSIVTKKINKIILRWKLKLTLRVQAKIIFCSIEL